MTREEFFAALAGGARWDVGVSINRTNPLPLDANSVFETLLDAENYAKTNVLAYPGQIITVVDTATVTAYVIAATGASGTLNKLASTTVSGDVTADIQALQGEIANIKNGTTVVGAATKATQDGDGKVISEEYAKKATVDTMATKLGTIAEGAQVNVIEGVAAKTDDGGFVDLAIVEKKVQLDLSNFATKADVSAIPKFAIAVVTDLPTENISESTIYLKAHEHGTGDSYDEYIYTAGKWEKIGNTDVDLSGYLKSADAATTYLTKTDATTTYATKTDVTNVTTNLTTNYVTNEALEKKGYITDAALAPYATTESVTTAIGNAKTELKTEIDNKQTADQVKQIIAESTIAGSKVQGNVAQATLADKVAHTLITAGGKTFNGSADVEITAKDIGALTEISVATNEAVGGFKTGYASTETNRAVQIDAETKTAFVNIPAAMTYDAGAGLSLTDGTFAIKNKGVTDAMIASVNVDKLTQTAGTYLTLNGGNASLT